MIVPWQDCKVWVLLELQPSDKLPLGPVRVLARLTDSDTGRAC